MIEITDKTSCSGCSACASVCPHKAIVMEPDVLGFMYPKVDVAKCINCGLCNKVCSFKEPPIKRDDYPKSYLVRHKNFTELLKSKSGAAFVVLSDIILKENGVVYGARFNSDHIVEHSGATTISGRDEFRGSKYIQSDLRGIFTKIKSDLLDEKKLLFSGTPCQVAGLKSYIGAKLSKNLYLVDLLCHGVAAPAIWKDYVNRIESIKGHKVLRCIPRNPKYGWYNNIDTFVFEDDSQYNSDYFTGYVYHKWITQRWSCKVCPFTKLKRVSDITLGDAWGIDRIAPEFDKDNLGCSLVLINTAKGESLFNAAYESMYSMPIDINKMMQPVMRQPTLLHPKRQAFEDAYAAHGFNYVKLIYLNNTLARITSSIWQRIHKIKHKFYR